MQNLATSISLADHRRYHSQASIASKSLQQSVHAAPESIYRQQNTGAMKNLSAGQPSEQGQQVSAQSGATRPAPTAQQLAQFASSRHQTGRKRRAPEAFAVEEEAPARRTQAPQPTGVYDHRFVEIAPAGQSQPVLPAITPSLPASNQEVPHIQPVSSTVTTNTELREQLREEVRRELHGEIEKLKKELEKGPWLTKAAEERGRRQGELDGHNKFSLNPERKPSEDQLNFDFLMKEKEKEITEIKKARDNWLRDTRNYTRETNATLRARDQEIERLREQLQHRPPPQQPPPPPPPLQQPLAPDNRDALVAEGRELQARFENQTQELVSLQQKYNQQANDLANLIARSERESQALSDRELQLGATSAELGAMSAELSSMSRELEKKTEEVSILRRERDQKAVELIDSSEELGRMSGEIKNLREDRHQDLEELQKCKQQVEAQSKEIVSLQARNGKNESSNEEKDRRIASLQELLDNSSRRQSNSSEKEEIKILNEKLADNQSLLNEARSEIISLRDHQARSELVDLSVTSETDNAAPTEAEEELVRAVLKKERETNEAENSRREDRVNASLEGLKETERERRQMLLEELERKEAELYDAQNKIGELEQQLLASSPSQPRQSPPSPLNTTSPPSPISAPHPPPPTLPSPAAAPSPSVQRSRFPGPRSLLTVILIFLLAFFVPYLQSLANSGSEYELVSSASRDDRMRWEAWELANRERNEGVPTYEESWRRTQEVGQMGGWGT